MWTESSDVSSLRRRNTVVISSYLLRISRLSLWTRNVSNSPLSVSTTVLLHNCIDRLINGRPFLAFSESLCPWWQWQLNSRATPAPDSRPVVIISPFVTTGISPLPATALRLHPRILSGDFLPSHLLLLLALFLFLRHYMWNVVSPGSRAFEPLDERQRLPLYQCGAVLLSLPWSYYLWPAAVVAGFAL